MTEKTTLTSSAPLLALTGIHKQFGGVRALRGAALTVQDSGVVHALMGENGSGKSTLLGILSGQMRPDTGTISFDGRVTTLASPVDALRQGIAMVTQETAVAPHLSVAENVLLGRGLAGSAVKVNWRATRVRAMQVLHRLELDYDPDWIVGNLRPDQRQMVEIARALSTDARVLVLDEPTSHFTDYEVESLFSVIRSLKSRGTSIIFVSHRLKEIFGIADEVTVLRDGQTVAAGPISQYSAESIVDAMVGDVVGLRGERLGRVRPRARPEQALLSVHGLSIDGALHEIDLTVDRGEIVGLAGLVGAGRSELLRALFGLSDVTAGEIRLDGDVLEPGKPREAIRCGVGYVPPDRKGQGVVLSMSLNDNLMLAHSMTRRRFRHPPRAEEATSVARVMREVRVRASSPRVAVGTLSGGNQQKVALGKWLVDDRVLLLLDEPTRGVDVSSKSEIHELLRSAAGRGVGLLVSSSENDELLQLCDRILVMFRGRIILSCTAQETDEGTLARYAAGHT